MTYLKPINGVNNQDDSSFIFRRHFFQPSWKLLHETDRVTGQGRGSRHVTQKLKNIGNKSMLNHLLKDVGHFLWA